MCKEHFGTWAASLACVAILSPHVKGDALSWNNAAGGAWSTQANWTPAGGPPTAGDTATFNLNNTYSVQTGTLTPSAADAMTVSAGNVTVESGSTFLLGNLDLITGAADLTISGFADLFVGSTNRAVRIDVGDRLDLTEFANLTIRSNSDVNASIMRLGQGAGNSALLTVTGSGSSLTTSHPTTSSHIGADGGSGSLSVENGASASLAVVQVIKGAISVGAGGTFTSEHLIVGRSLEFGFPEEAEFFVSGAGSVATQTSGITDVAGTGRLAVGDSGAFNADSLWVRGGAVADIETSGVINANTLSVFENGLIELLNGTIAVATNATASHGAVIGVRGGTLNAAILSASTGGGLIEIDGGTVNAELAGPLDGGKIIILSGKFDADRLSLDDVGSRVTLDGGELETGRITITGGAQFDWKSGVLTLTDGTFTVPLAVPFGATMNTARDGAVTMNGAFFQSASSTINAQGNTTLGSTSAVNGFASQGTLVVGSHTVTLRDANDAVFDSSALVTLGAGASPGTLAASNGLTLDFGGNISGYGTVNTPHDALRPLVNNGHIASASTSQPITLAGYVKGVGTLDHVVITGTAAPGFSPATVNFGSVTYAGTLQIELAGIAAGQFDVLNHSGIAALGGALEVSFLGGFSPRVGDTFEFLTAASVTGQFVTTADQLPTLPGGKRWRIDYQTRGVSLEVLAPFDADFDEDGDVDGADLVRWRVGFGETGTAVHLDGDANGDQDVDGADFLTWQRQLGSTSNVAAAGSATAPTPEPPASTLVVAAIIIATMRRRPRQNGIWA